jgi:hypothetical protein
MAVTQLANDGPRFHVERREEIPRAVPDVVVRMLLRLAGRTGKTGVVPSVAWICGFSSTQSTRTRSGGSR